MSHLPPASRKGKEHKRLHRGSLCGPSPKLAHTAFTHIPLRSQPHGCRPARETESITCLCAQEEETTDCMPSYPSVSSTVNAGCVAFLPLRAHAVPFQGGQSKAHPASAFCWRSSPLVMCSLFIKWMEFLSVQHLDTGSYLPTLHTPKI